MMSYRAARGSGRNTLISRYTNSLGNAVHRHRAEIALRASNVEAELANRARAAFIANMSHELRTPLNAIIGFSDVLKVHEADTLTTEQVSEFCGYINDSAVDLLSMINRLLELTKLQSGAVSINPDTIDINEIIDVCFSELSIKAADANISLSRNTERGLNSVYADQSKTRQVLFNIIDNAVKFSEKNGTIDVSVSKAPNDRVRIIVKDEGIGMSEPDIELALSRFGQIDSGLDRRYDGSGLGLPIAKALIELQDGRLTIESSPNAGTSVALLMPACARSDRSRSVHNKQ